MNKTVTSLVALGVGAALYSRSRDMDLGDMFSNRNMKKARKRIKKAFR